MADNVIIDNGGLTDFTVSADEAASGLVQRFKIAYSADGSDTHVTADSSGLLVNLGVNNDVTVTGGTVTVGGTAITTVAGTANVSIVGGTATMAGSLAAGTAYIGSALIGNATARADMLSLASGTALAVGLYDGTGAQVTFSAPITITATLTNGTAAYSIGDTMGTTITLANASVASGKTGHVVGARCFVTSNMAAEDLRLWLFSSSVTPSADNAAFLISATDIVKTQGIISFEDWFDGGTAHVSVGKMTPVGHPLAFVTSGAANLYGVMESYGTGTYATATVSIELIALRD